MIFLANSPSKTVLGNKCWPILQQLIKSLSFLQKEDTSNIYNIPFP